MAKIFILNSTMDYELAKKITIRLNELSHLVISSNEFNFARINTEEESMNNFIEDADGLIVIVNSESNNSINFRNEIASALGYFKNIKGKFILPVITDDSEVPDYLGNIVVQRVKAGELDYVANRICEAVINIFGRNKAEEIKRKEEIEKIELSSQDYIQKALEKLEDREKQYKTYASICYLAGFIMLIIGVCFGIINSIHINLSPEIQWYQYLFIGAKTLIVIVFLLVASKYVFSLGKAYMNESLKNSDRVHAISFGEFYLKAYGEKATWVELKEVFQYWNLDKNSYFTNLKSEDFDPKLIEILEKISKIVQLKK